MSNVIETYTSHEQKGILLNANESSKNLPSCIIDEIKDLELTKMTPIDALNTLFRIQDKIKNRW